MDYFDDSVSVTPPNGHLETLPITLGPNWEPNDIRMVFMSGSGVSGSSGIPMPMTPDPMTGFTAAYVLNSGIETHGVYYRRLALGDTDNVSVSWPKPQSWRHFMVGMVTVRGADLTTAPTAGSLSVAGGITYAVADTTDSVTVTSKTVPRAGSMLYFLGDIAAPITVPWPSWPVSIGVPDGWTHIAATDKSGNTFYEFGTDPALVMCGKAFTGAGSTGVVEFPAGKGSPAFAGLYAFITPAADVSVTLGAA